MDTDHDWLAEQFDGLRPRLRTIAYRMLGSVSDSDDAVQEAWLRLSRADSAAVENLAAWLTTVVARVCLDMLRARSARREEYIGSWLPEPIVLIDDAEDHIGVEDGDQPLEVAVARRREEGVDQLTLLVEARLGVQRRALHTAASSARELTRGVGRAVEDGGDLVEWDAEHVVEHEGEPLARRQRLEHDEQRQADRVCDQHLVLR